MKRIHNQKSARIEIGKPFEEVLHELLKSTNTNNLSNNWNITDMTRYAVAELWKRTGKPLPLDAAKLLKKYYTDLDGVHSG
jgi:hypothetical protein